MLNIHVAGLGSRMAAALIDMTLRVILVIATTTAAASVGGAMVAVDWIFVVALLFAVFGSYLGYPVFFETVWRGKTPGKAIMGIRVVTIQGAPIRFRHAFIRAALGIFEIDGTYGVVGVIAMACSKRTQRLGDMVAGTIVFRERQAMKPPQPIRFEAPAGTEDLMARLDTTGLRPVDYANVRAYLVRAPKLVPSARQEVAAVVVGELESRLALTKPAEVSNELYLFCIAAAYQARFNRQPIG